MTDGYASLASSVFSTRSHTTVSQALESARKNRRREAASASTGRPRPSFSSSSVPPSSTSRTG